MIAAVQKHFRREVDLWSASTFVLALLILTPLIVVVVGLSDAGPKWDHIASTVLWKYVWNTVLVVPLVGVLAILMAVPPAWLVSAFEFPGRRIFEWALVLPLAIPTYVAAFVYYPGLEAAIPFIVSVRQNFGFDASQVAEKIVRYGLLSILLASVLYPYLFISARSSFSQQRRGVIEAAQTLGRGPISVFFSVALPLARPALVAGLSLIVMEVVNDYGAVHFFGVPTLTEGIFRTWFGLGDRSSALRIAGLVMLAVLCLLWAEQRQRGRARFSEHSVNSTPLARRKLGTSKAVLAIVVCVVPLGIGFLYPVFRLLGWASQTFGKVLQADFWQQLGNSLLLSLGTAAGLTAIAVIFAFATRLHHAGWLRVTSRMATLGYAAPGAVVAVGVMVALGGVDRSLGQQVLSGTYFAIIFAYTVRFLAVPFHPVRAGMNRVCGSLDEASRVLGQSPLLTLWKINLPLMWTTLLAATMLVFVDILKELPLTMILRPANFETLATTAFGLASEGRFRECSVPSLIIILAGALGLMVLNRLTKRKTG